MAAKKKSAKGKGAAKKKAAPKKKAAAKKPAAKKAASKAKPKPKPKPKAAAPRPTAPAPAPGASAPTKPVATPSPFAAPAPSEGAFTAHDVNRGHIFGLRPRANTAFSPQAFENARRELAEQRYATIEQAARAVAERALELSNQRPSREPFPST